MSRTTITLAAGAMALAASVSAQPTPPAERLVLRVPGMENATVTRDIVYHESNGQALKLDVYRPHNVRASDRRPAVLLVSGATDARNWPGYIDLGQLLAASGFVGVNFSKRYERGQFLDGARDLEALVTHIRQNAERYNVDADRLCLWSFSGGALLLGRGMKGLPGVNCLVNYYGPADLRSIIPMLPPSMQEAAREISALDLIDSRPAGMPPMLIVRAGLDQPQLNEQMVRVATAALAANLAVQVINYPTGQHGFDVRDDKEESRHILRRTLQFVREALAVDARDR